MKTDENDDVKDILKRHEDEKVTLQSGKIVFEIYWIEKMMRDLESRINFRFGKISNNREIDKTKKMIETRMKNLLKYTTAESRKIQFKEVQQ